MDILTIEVGLLQVNCYVVWDAPGSALVIDPGSDAEAIERALAQRDLTVAAYLLTHGHADHVSALADLCERHPAPVRMHPDDARWAFTSANRIEPFYSAPRVPPCPLYPLEDNAEYCDGGLRYRVIAAPGHTPGGVALYFPDQRVLFAGDTLFEGSVGRTDIPGADPRALARSLARLAELPDETLVYPGHGRRTTIGIEKAANVFLRTARR